MYFYSFSALSSMGVFSGGELIIFISSPGQSRGRAIVVALALASALAKC